MSSRKSSRKSVTSTPSPVAASSNSMQKPLIFVSIITIIYNALVLGYLIKLQDQQCKCIRDWRHDFLKYFTSFMIIYSILAIILSGTNYMNFMLSSSAHHILMLFNVVNVWCLFTYIGDLDKTNCKCAVEDQKNMHSFLYVWRYVLVIGVTLSLIAIILNALH